MSAPLVRIKDLKVTFNSRRGAIRAVTGTGLSIHPGEFYGLVGESGCGKSVTALSLMGLLPRSAHVTGEIIFKGQDVARLDAAGMRTLRGREIAMVFQDPFESLNPVMTIGAQIRESIAAHGGPRGAAAMPRLEQLLKEVQIPDPHAFVKLYPHEASGGMRQRAMLAMALACDPALIIADEPTTALDVTTQAEILDLFAALKRKRGMAILFITHDLALVSRSADTVGVMYAGRIIETARCADFFKAPQHPYSKALLSCVPRLDAVGALLEPIPGEVPNPVDRPAGCAFHPRCTWVQDRCRRENPDLMHRKGAEAHESACWEVHNDS